MSKDINVQLVDELMGCITQSDAWYKAVQEDPEYKRAEARLDEDLERVEELIPRNLYVELSDAVSAKISAAGDIGILHGMHIVFAMQDVASRPSDLSRYILARMGKEE